MSSGDDRVAAADAGTAGRQRWRTIRLGLLSGRTWARVVAITLAMLSALANFLWLPYYPFWALTLITLDVFVIWAVAAHGRELRERA